MPRGPGASCGRADASVRWRRPDAVAFRFAMLAAVACLAFPGSALASVRYSSPNAVGAEPCSADAPCPLATAINGALNGDEVVVNAGDYVIPSSAADCSTGPTDGLDIAHSITVHGVAGQPRPRIIGSAGVCTTVRSLALSTLRHLEITNETTVTGGVPQTVV